MFLLSVFPLKFHYLALPPLFCLILSLLLIIFLSQFIWSTFTLSSSTKVQDISSIFVSPTNMKQCDVKGSIFTWSYQTKEKRHFLSSRLLLEAQKRKDEDWSSVVWLIFHAALSEAVWGLLKQRLVQRLSCKAASIEDNQDTSRRCCTIKSFAVCLELDTDRVHRQRPYFGSTALSFLW